MSFTSNEQNKLIVKEYIEKVLNTGETSSISEYIGQNYVEIYNGKKYELGIDGAKTHIIGVRNTYPDLKLVINNQICEGEWVATSYTMTGTQMGEWLGIKPTNKKIKVTGVNINRIVDGKIVEHGGAANLLEPLLKAEAIRIVSNEEK
ncbi:MAG: ester cyclase [Bacteroidetes bacterium]|nr:ester cyclase [Bacteroidota bacterium]